MKIKFLYDYFNKLLIFIGKPLLDIGSCRDYIKKMSGTIPYYDNIIIGAGIAGIRAAETVRADKPDAGILVISAEPGFPYKRTNIDKHIAAGFTESDFLLHTSEWFNENRIDFFSETAVEKIIPDEKLIILRKGEKYSFRKLLIAAGASPNIPDFIRIRNIPSYYIRTKYETLNFLKELKTSDTVTIIGGGVQSVEIAEQCTIAGKKVSLITRSRHLLKKYFPEDYSIEIEKLISENGIDLNLSAEILNIEYRADKGYDLEIPEKSVRSDLLVCACGIIPNTNIVSGTGIKTEKGIIVDGRCETNIPGIFAAGDCAQYKNSPPAGLWHSAEFMGTIAGHNMAGNAASFGSKTFRLKCELFNRFFFSQNYSCRNSSVGTDNNKEPVRQRWFFNESGAAGVLMTDDKTRAKTYEKAVNESWSIEQIKRELPL